MPTFVIFLVENILKFLTSVPGSSDQGCQMVCFQTKNPIWVNFGGSHNGKSWYILRPFGLFFYHCKYFMAIWYILWSFGTFLPVLVCCTTKKLATLAWHALYALPGLFASG
jgi:hypothetical protein